MDEVMGVTNDYGSRNRRKSETVSDFLNPSRDESSTTTIGREALLLRQLSSSSLLFFLATSFSRGWLGKQAKLVESMKLLTEDWSIEMGRTEALLSKECIQPCSVSWTNAYLLISSSKVFDQPVCKFIFCISLVMLFDSKPPSETWSQNRFKMRLSHP